MMTQKTGFSFYQRAKRAGNTIAVTAALSLCMSNATAGPLDITNIDGSWINPVPSANVTALSNTASPGTDSIRWGGTAGDINSGSGYDFTAASNITPVALGTAFVLGTFTHLNLPITQTISAVEYAFSFDTNGSPANLASIFSFDHNETPNSTGSSPADDDVVTVTSATLNHLITVGTDTYYFNLLGFSVDGGMSFGNIFSSPENGSNSVRLYGIVTNQPVGAVPTPGTLLLIMCGLLGFTFRRKRS
ncbi:MAG: THxN family PEP-CTERM protein [Parahaliea sp.]